MARTEARNTGEALERLVTLMARLRAQNGCPWDREQDLRSLRPYLMEESFEVLDEMDRVSSGGAWGPFCEELGDLLFQIVFHAQLANELGEFAMADVCEAISNKIESRHPHVFGDLKVAGAEQVLDNWARLKAEEKTKKFGHAGSVLDGVPTAAPALLRAERLTEKASRLGFDWPDLKGVRGKLDEELGELDEAIASGDRDALEHELGDVLFSLANLARFLKTPAEDALRSTIRRFTSRFHAVEAGLRAQAVPFGEATLAQMDALWDEAKTVEKSLPPKREVPRPSVRGLRVPVSDVEVAARAWKTLAPLLQWEALSTGAKNERGFGDASFRLTFVETAFVGEGSPKSGAPWTVELEAPSAAAVTAFAEAISGLPQIRQSLHHPSGLALEFEDSAGLHWRYAVGFHT